MSSYINPSSQWGLRCSLCLREAGKSGLYCRSLQSSHNISRLGKRREFAVCLVWFSISLCSAGSCCSDKLCSRNCPRHWGTILSLDSDLNSNPIDFKSNLYPTKQSWQPGFVFLAVHSTSSVSSSHCSPLSSLPCPVSRVIVCLQCAMTQVHPCTELNGLFPAAFFFDSRFQIIWH